MPAIKKAFTRSHFEALTTRHAISIKELIDQFNNGVISEYDYFFSLEGLKIIGYEVYTGSQANARLQQRPKSKWSIEVCSTDGRKIIKESFTT